MIPTPIKRTLNPFSIALTYTLLGGFWVFFSEPFLINLIIDPEWLKRAKLINSWGFIVVSAHILYLLIRRHEIEIDRHQDSMHRVIRALMVFRGCNKVITHDRVEQDILKKVCRTVVKVGGYRMAWVGFALQDERKSIQAVAYWGHEDGYLDTVQATWDESERGQGPAGTTIRTGLTTVIQHIPTDPRFRLWREEAIRHGYQSAIALPLREAKDTFGALVILADEADAFNSEEISLLEELAEDLSFGIKTSRGEAAREKGQKDLTVLVAVIEQATEGVLIFDAEGICQYGNPAIEKICEISTQKMIGQSIHNLECYKRNLNFYQAVEATIQTGEVHSGIYANHKKDGTEYMVAATISPVWGLTESGSSFVASVRDITLELQLEEQLRTAQKMEAIATLSAGIAHDFNNILAAIITNTEMSLEDVEGQDDLRENLEIVLKAGLRGKNLVKQIKTLGQQTTQERQPVHLDLVIQECLELLRASLPTTIEIKRHIVPNLGVVPADPTQLHQVILNLCTNAADAMRLDGGILEVSLHAIEIRAGQNSSPELQPGNYQKLTIRDTGHGMTREIMERIFDPFFTTKELGKGTGLGLSVVHSIIKSHNGSISVNSSLGQGTAFEIYLPQIYCVETPEEEAVAPLPSTGNECILLVDDEEDLAQGGKKILERLGYQVIAETDPRKALKRFTTDPSRFDLLITDQTMPHLTGEMLALEVLKIRAGLPIILCSGLGSTPQTKSAGERARALGVREFLAKPFERKELSAMIRRLLNHPQGAGTIH